MTRVIGYVVLSAALLGALLALLVVEAPHAGASLLDVLQDGTVLASYRDAESESVGATDQPSAATNREALDSFLQGLRERSSADATEVTAGSERIAVFRLTLGHALLALLVAGLAGGAMLAFGGTR